MINKKGISPLIATVLIIGFTVALGAVIFIWGSNFFKETTENVDMTSKVQIACTNADFKVLSCVKEGQAVSIENKGSTSLKFRIRGSDNELSDISDTIESLGIETLSCASLCGDSITVFPVVTIDGKDSECTQAGKTAVCGRT